MRLDAASQHYHAFLMRVGNGTEPTYGNGLIKLPEDIVLPWPQHASDGDALKVLINAIYPDIPTNYRSAEWIAGRAILSTRNDFVEGINDTIMQLFPGEEITYLSFDSVPEDTHNLYQLEFLNSLTPSGLPPHRLVLKKDVPIMLLRNLDQAGGLCNGTRLLVRHLHNNVIDAEIATPGPYLGKRVFIPRIPLLTPEDTRLPFVLKRKQFPVRPAFAFTINKSQGQTLQHVGVYLPEPVFTHGQLYVALSRGTSSSNIWVLVKNGSLPGLPGTYTKNIVFTEVL